MKLDENEIYAVSYRVLEAAENNNWELHWFRDPGVVQVNNIPMAQNDDELLIVNEACDRMLNEFNWIRQDTNALFKVTELGRAALTNKRSSNRLSSSIGVFIVHGHDDAARTEVENLIRKLKLDPIILADQTNQGATVIEKFERESDRANFSVVLMTPDDVGCAKGAYKQQDLANMPTRARQNVVLELGYFFAKLGRGKVAALQKGHIEQPSDVNGIVYISMNGNWKFELAKEMKAAGLPVDLNDL